MKRCHAGAPGLHAGGGDGHVVVELSPHARDVDGALDARHEDGHEQSEREADRQHRPLGAELARRLHHVGSTRSAGVLTM